MEERYFICVECGIRCNDPIEEHYWNYQYRGLCNCCGSKKIIDREESIGEYPFKFKPEYVGYRFCSGMPYPLVCECLNNAKL